MPRHTVASAMLAAISLFLVAPQPAGAEPIQWSYTGEIVTTGPNSSPFSGENFGPKVLIASDLHGGLTPGLQVQFADGSGAGTGSANVNAFQMRTTTSAGPFEGPFHKELHTFDLTVGLKDGASGASGFLTFKGSLDGAIQGGTAPWGTPHGTQLQVAFTDPSSQALVLGDHKYEVSIEPFAYRYFPEVAQDGFSPYQGVPIRVQVSPVSEVPEPSTLALAAAGLAGLGLRAWRRRQLARSVPVPA